MATLPKKGTNREQLTSRPDYWKIYNDHIRGVKVIKDLQYLNQLKKILFDPNSIYPGFKL